MKDSYRSKFVTKKYYLTNPVQILFIVYEKKFFLMQNFLIGLLALANYIFFYMYIYGLENLVMGMYKKQKAATLLEKLSIFYDILSKKDQVLGTFVASPFPIACLKVFRKINTGNTRVCILQVSICCRFMYRYFKKTRFSPVR